jgi:catechol 2,3-dioxygenase-like lactoylglutathione lyase family enzyme/ribosomal protein S18 acetylase RimI-like enzyme
LFFTQMLAANTKDTMQIDHIAIWTNDLERLRDFYSRFFNCMVSDRYNNKKKQFSSYCLSFKNGARIEIMKRLDITDTFDNERIGLSHFAIGVGTIEKVDKLTKNIENAGVAIDSYPRKTGDGYYESVILDPDKNRIELTAFADYIITEATENDLEDILYLQKCCYLSEAEIYKDYSISPLTQSFENISNDFNNQTIFKLECKGKIIGSVRAFVQNDSCYIGKLIVDKDYQNMGFGKLLLDTVENKFNKIVRFELFTGYKSEKNLYIYKKQGYNEFKEERLNGMIIKYMEKCVSR